VRLYTPLDLRNIKDTYVRVAFRRLDQWLRDLAGNLSPSQGGSLANTLEILQTQVTAPTVQSFRRLDDFNRQFVDTNDISIRTWDGFSWKHSSTGASVFKDSRTLADTSYPDTGIWVAKLGTGNGDTTSIISGDNTADALSIFSRLRPGTEYIIGIGVPVGGQMNAFAGFEYDNGGNSFDPDVCTRFLYYADAAQDYDFSLGPPGTVTFHNVSNKRDFVALQINTQGGGKDVYGIGTATAFTLATGLAMAKITFQFGEGTTHGNEITVIVEGIGSVTVDDVDPVGWFQLGGRVRQSGNASVDQRAYFDYVGIDIPTP